MNIYNGTRESSVGSLIVWWADIIYTIVFALVAVILYTIYKISFLTCAVEKLKM